MTLVWKGDQVLARMTQAASRGLLRAAHIVDAEAKRLILDTPKSGITYGRHKSSAPGEPFASDSGKTIQTFRVQLINPLTAVLTVGGQGPRMEFGTSKMAPRPFLRRAFANKRSECEAAVANEVRKVLPE